MMQIERTYNIYMYDKIVIIKFFSNSIWCNLEREVVGGGGAPVLVERSSGGGSSIHFSIHQENCATICECLYAAQAFRLGEGDRLTPPHLPKTRRKDFRKYTKLFLKSHFPLETRPPPQTEYLCAPLLSWFQPPPQSRRVSS